MKFLILIITFLILYSTNIGSIVQSTKLFDGYLHMLDRLLDYLNVKMPILRLVALLGVFSIATMLIYMVLSKILLGVLGFLFVIFMLLFCFTEIRFSTGELPAVLVKQAINQLFAVLFWYLVLGSVGAVLYVLNDHIRREHYNAAVSYYADQIQKWLDWIPVRLLAFCFALVGNFTAVSQVWLKGVTSLAQANDTFLVNCFDAACEKENLTGKENVILSEYLIKLIYRSLLVWFSVIAMVILL